jgi:hypothetical protein
MPAVDIYLYDGEVSPGDIRLADPSVPRGWWPGTSDLTQEQNLSGVDQLSPWGIVLYTMGALVPQGAGGAVFRPIGSPVVRRIEQ